MQALGRDRLALAVVGDHVGGRDQGRQAVGVVGVMALDRDRDPLRQAPAPRQHAADQGVVDAKPVAFLAQSLLGRLRQGVEVTAVAGMKVGDDQAPDVMQERGDRKFVAVLPADRAADLIGGLLGGKGVDAEALGPHLAPAVGLEEVEDRRGAGDGENS